MQAFARSILDTVRHPLLILDAGMRVVVANPAFYTSFGSPSSAVVGHSFFELDAGRWDQPCLRTLLDDVISRDGSFKNLEVEYDCPRVGRRAMVISARRVVHDEDGRPMVLLAIEDDDERRRARDELRQSNVDLELRVAALEQRGRERARSVETTRRQTLLQSDRTIENLDQKARDLAVFVEIVRQETQSQVETEIAALGQQAESLAVSVEAVREMTLLHSDSQIAALGESELATAKLNEDLERRVLDRTRQLEAANRELEAFCYSVSHDLRAPLRALDGFSQELLLRYADGLDEQGKHYLRRIQAGTQRMGHLIDDLLTLSRVTRSEMRLERVDLTALAEAVFAELLEREPGRRVTFTARPGLITVGDAPLLRIVLENLLGNAWKFTGKNPTAKIEFDRAESPGQPAFVVRDDGAGFDMEYAGKLFGAFQRLHSDREFAGTGIGLATVQRIVRRHGGEVWAEGGVSRGAAFSFTLPGSEDHP